MSESLSEPSEGEGKAEALSAESSWEECGPVCGPVLVDHVDAVVARGQGKLNTTFIRMAQATEYINS